MRIVTLETAPVRGWLRRDRSTTLARPVSDAQPSYGDPCAAGVRQLGRAWKLCVLICQDGCPNEPVTNFDRYGLPTVGHEATTRRVNANEQKSNTSQSPKRRRVPRAAPNRIALDGHHPTYRLPLLAGFLAHSFVEVNHFTQILNLPARASR